MKAHEHRVPVVGAVERPNRATHITSAVCVTACRPGAATPLASRVDMVAQGYCTAREGGARDRGSASIWLVGIGLAVVLLASSLITVGGVLVARHRAGAAADLSALAGAAHGAEGEGPACARARQIASLQEAEVTSCQLDGLDLVVTVEISGFTVLGPARATARAGPVRAAGADEGRAGADPIGRSLTG